MNIEKKIKKKKEKKELTFMNHMSTFSRHFNRYCKCKMEKGKFSGNRNQNILKF